MHCSMIEDSSVMIILSQLAFQGEKFKEAGPFHKAFKKIYESLTKLVKRSTAIYSNVSMGFGAKRAQTFDVQRQL
jgi:hypothetical protein